MKKLLRIAALAWPLVASAAWAHGEDPGVAPKTDGAAAGSATSVTVTSEVARPPLPFKGSILILDQSVTPDTLFAGAQQSQIPSYQWWFSFRPRYALPHHLSFRGRADMTLEWTNAADTTHYRELQWGDIWTDVVYTGLPKVLGVDTSVGLRALWPVSLESQMHHTIVTLGATLGFSRDWEHTKVGDFNLMVAFAGTHPFNSSNVGGVRSTYGCQSFEFAPTVCDQTEGAMNTAFSFVSIFGGTYKPIPALSFGLTYIIFDKWAYQTPDAVLYDQTGPPVTVARSPDDQRLRQSGWFLASLDYDVRSWVNLSLGYYVFRPLLDPNGQYGNPVYSPGGNSRIFFSTTIALDHFYDTFFRNN